MFGFNLIYFWQREEAASASPGHLCVRVEGGSCSVGAPEQSVKGCRAPRCLWEMVGVV